MENIEKKVAEVFSVLFKKTVSVGDDISMENEDQWDSMKHIEVIMTLEEELNVSFEPEMIPTLISMDKVVRTIKAMEV